ncbi:type II toxin-antitoxin system HipA family toxin [Budvicia diplopodorum]|uniref:type II toxin-antitoxin system HipA family toxin n=1 Tax=Budvicia diplopodorum TaxID=1119056 RepID=UPI00135BF557|nr:type II toxin-antitoxin system HipA family toxin [Budvicia diplopodorum]
MNVFHPVRRLDVHRRMSDGQRVLVGTLAQNARGIYFQYSDEYISHFSSLSPFKLAFNAQLQQATSPIHGGLFGTFADSLPDGWGLLLMDRVFRQQGVSPTLLTAMDRLAYVGSQGSGALEYTPTSDYRLTFPPDTIDIATLAEEACSLFEGQTEVVLAQLANAGGSGGARPKSLIYISPDNPNQASTIATPGYSPWLVKFTSKSLQLQHEEGLCEAAYLRMAGRAGLKVPEWKLISPPQGSQAIAWLAMKRFDCTEQHGRYHLHSLCGLLDADFRAPSIDYETLIKASQVLCKSPAVGQLQFSRAMFNLFSLNQDDHTKNWAFLQDDRGNWTPSPFYDVTYSPNPYGEHTTAFNGYGKAPPIKAIQRLAEQANFDSWASAQAAIEEIVAALSNWTEIAKELNISPATTKMISRSLNEVYQQNKLLLS